ncbi:TfoX/Sxy family protein [Alloiococcus sp. CFN-8]|uniref:TfoX/Sxy family protein n=1 Tax=Alloiococcus sp. CFN-8 TaxID=3416081 RepID=UPI003CF6BF29
MGELRELPNIGTTLEMRLKRAGIATAEDLIAMGSKEAWMKIKAIDSTACLNTLYSLEGAIHGIKWPDLSEGVMNSLKDFYKSKIVLIFN